MKSVGKWLAKRLAWLKRLGDRLSQHPGRLRRIGKIAIGTSALIVVVVGLLSLRSRPAAVAFTRVGGSTSVETAVDASRFWLTPPRHVVETPLGATQQVMLLAAQCAVTLDAPLLFISPNPARQQLVNATIRQWQQVTPGSARPKMILSRADGQGCGGKRKAEVNGLSTLTVPYPLVPLPVQQQDSLAPVVVFAAALAPGDAPDVATGLALAAHMASPMHQVSLVVVPRYLEADSKFEDLLRRQHELVIDGVVLGETPTVPDETRALLRDLLFSPNWLAQLVASLTPVGALAVGILALLGLGAVAAPAVAREVFLLIESMERVVEGRDESEPPRQPAGKGDDGVPENRGGRPDHQPETTVQASWIADVAGKKITVRLGSGSKVTGVVERLEVAAADSTVPSWWSRALPGRRSGSADACALLMLRIRDATIVAQAGAQSQAQVVLVPLEKVDLIAVGVRDTAEGRLA